MLLLAPTASYAKDLYVNPTGNDSITYANNDAAHPWATLGRAAWGSTNFSAPNPNEAARAGDTVNVAAGTYSGPGQDQRFTVAFNPANSGTASNPIVFRATGLVRLTLSSSVGPTIGCNSRNYITWDGFTIDETTAPSRADTGPVTIFGSTGCVLQNLDIRGIYAQWLDNHNGIRIEQSNFTVIRNNSVSGIGSQPQVHGQNDAAVMMYDSNDTIIENNTFFDCGVGVFVKGIHPGFTQVRTIVRRNVIYNMGVVGISFLGSHFSKAYQNIIYDSNWGLNWSGLTGVEPTDDIYANNTVHNSRQAGMWFRGSSNQWQRLRVFNNLFTGNGETSINTDPFTSPGDVTFEHNGYFGFPLAFAWVNGYRTFAVWQSTWGKDSATPISVTSDPRYANATNHDFRLCTGAGLPVASCTGASPVLSLGVDVLDLNGNGSTTDPIRLGPYVIGNEIIGRSGGFAGAPPAPTNLSITRQ